MLDSTIQIIRTALWADHTLTIPERKRLLALLRNSNGSPVTKTPKILRRAVVAERLGIGLRALDRLCQSGQLTKVKLPGRSRAAGILESNLDELLLASAGNTRLGKEVAQR